MRYLNSNTFYLTSLFIFCRAFNFLSRRFEYGIGNNLVQLQNLHRIDTSFIFISTMVMNMMETIILPDFFNFGLKRIEKYR